MRCVSAAVSFVALCCCQRAGGFLAPAPAGGVSVSSRGVRALSMSSGHHVSCCCHVVHERLSPLPRLQRCTHEAHGRTHVAISSSMAVDCEDSRWRLLLYTGVYSSYCYRAVILVTARTSHASRTVSSGAMHDAIGSDVLCAYVMEAASLEGGLASPKIL